MAPADGRDGIGLSALKPDAHINSLAAQREALAAQQRGRAGRRGKTGSPPTWR